MRLLKSLKIETDMRSPSKKKKGIAKKTKTQKNKRPTLMHALEKKKSRKKSLQKSALRQIGKNEHLRVNKKFRVLVSISRKRGPHSQVCAFLEGTTFFRLASSDSTQKKCRTTNGIKSYSLLNVKYVCDRNNQKS